MADAGHRWSGAVSRGVRAASGLRFALGYRAGATVGSRLGDTTGDSIEFMDYRAYEPGDDVRRIDWNAYARTDKILIRRHLQEVSPNVELLIDGSKSMDLATSTKSGVAAAVVAALHAAALRDGFSPRLVGLSERPKPFGTTLEAFTHRADFGSRCDLSSLRSGRSSGETRVLVSDMLVAESPESILRRLSSGARRSALVHVVSVEDIEPPSPGVYRLVDIEHGGELEVQVDASAADRFRARAGAFRESIAEACRRTATPLATVIAEEAWTDDSVDLSSLVACGILEVA